MKFNKHDIIIVLTFIAIFGGFIFWMHYTAIEILPAKTSTFLTKFVYIPLHLETWMDPRHCVPLEWFRSAMVFSGNYINITYFIFAIGAYYLRPVATVLSGRDLGMELCWVFIWCGITHWLHTMSYVSQFYKPFLLFTYIPLIYMHTRLVYTVIISVIYFYKHFRMDDIATALKLLKVINK